MEKEKVFLIEEKLKDLEIGQNVTHKYQDIILKQVNKIENRFYGLVFFLVIYLVLLSSLIYFD